MDIPGNNQVKNFFYFAFPTTARALCCVCGVPDKSKSGNIGDQPSAEHILVALKADAAVGSSTWICHGDRDQEWNPVQL